MFAAHRTARQCNAPQDYELFRAGNASGSHDSSDPDILAASGSSADPTDTNVFYQPLTLPSDVEDVPSPHRVPVAKLVAKYAALRSVPAESAYATVQPSVPADEPDVMFTAPIQQSASSDAESEFV